MPKFIEVEVFNNDIQNTISQVIINIDDISYIEDNTVRMKSQGERSTDELISASRRSETYKTSYYLIQEHFSLTDDSLKKLLKSIEIL